jgi:hypothetical protein
MDKEKPPFEGPYTKKPAATTDKSGAVHSPMSRARHLARIALQQKQKKTQKEEVEQVAELKDRTVKSYAHKAIADTMQGKKDRNPGIKRAFNQLAGLKEPLMKAKNAMKEGAYSEKEIEDAEMAKNPGMRSYRKPAPKPAPAKPVKENMISNFLNSFKRSSTMLGKKEAPPKEEPKKDSKMSFSGFSRSSSMKM